MSKKAKRTALRRRARTERIESPVDDYSREILRELERAGEPLSVRELAQQLGIRAREQRAFKSGLAALERSGQVMQNRAGALLVARKIALVSGRVDGHPDGHGFLVPDEGGPSVFLPPHEMAKLMHGDRAAVRVGGQDARGRPVGAIVDVLERAKRRIVGSGMGALPYTPRRQLFRSKSARSGSSRQRPYMAGTISACVIFSC